MIVFDLRCDPAGHVFEAWFGSSDDYEGQQARGLVSCPICGSGTVGKAVMAPRLSGTGEAPDPRVMKQALTLLAKAQAEMLSKSEDVGTDFARRARAIHDGEEAAKPIYGQATAPEVRDLLSDGVPVAPLPLPVRPPERDN
ncbi:DUF1178 family protein [Sphingomonas sp. ID0503]|uniref:DUF1178 family protein n=1 Tax=Sphingomonas sp. ID0503 TaxID=3399691 RepID=UPI003AFB4D1F